MNNIFYSILNSLDGNLKKNHTTNDNFIHQIELDIELILKSLSELESQLLIKGFSNIKDEIFFFKNQKPVILSKLIYYNAVYKIETKKPYGAKPIRKYLKKELRKLKRFYNNNLDFYKYYRSNNSFLDEKYFVRGKHDIKLWLDTYYFQSDHTFSTSHDYKVAKIIANDLIQVYIEDQLYKKIKKNKSKTQKKLKWTGSKVALIELIYALHYQNVFDNGNNDIREVAQYFESAFEIDLGNFYQTYLELRNRKMNRTKFLDALRDELIRRMDEQDEK
ncbi:RteC domain-containing protein [Sphingobacterium sp. HMA12]|uniref:RteC domain-containing protein n=1 Tax=Sphingobacterium sp. HMA12 TaxID=2050894 RepID=UPI000CEA4D71|nr:RteC domain-containing protein [Sphingobacterium sp. HMA12]